MYPHYTHSNNIIYCDLVRVASYDGLTPEQMDAQTAYLQNLSNLDHDARIARETYQHEQLRQTNNYTAIQQINRQRLLKQGKIAQALKI
jgi:hypothetical protein